MAATTDQLALTKTNRTPNVATSTRQAVPAFLNKLYNMVSNPETDELVRWSDEGDSFYIPSHERLSKELLPRFFKHGNFSSFVRQLNMYGFHKVPHLQQGVLQNSTETELWQFQNPHFQRGQPDLLCLITRKKTGTNVDGIGVADETQQGTNAVGGPASTTSSNNNHQAGGPLDLTVLTSSLSAIKKHQTSLSSELKTLQESNQHLWNEALAARDRHKKHQDTINKILKFLASVFGNGTAGATPSATTGGSSTGRDGRASPGPGALVPRKRPRLMIENGSADDSEDEDFVHFPANVSVPPDVTMLEDHEMSEGRISEAPETPLPPVTTGQPSMSVSGGAKVEPPPTPSLESVAPTPAPAATATTSSRNPQLRAPSLSTSLPPASPMSVIRRSPIQPLSTASTPMPSPPTPMNPPSADTSAPTPGHTPLSFPQPDEHDHAQDQLYQETISKLLSSPTALQRIIASLSAQGPEHPPTPAHPPFFPDASHPQSEIAPYYGNLMNLGINGAMDMEVGPTLEPHMARLDEETEALGADVENVGHDINELIREWGFTPEMLDHQAGLDHSAALGHSTGLGHSGGMGYHSSAGTGAGAGMGGQGVGMNGFGGQPFGGFGGHGIGMNGINGTGVGTGQFASIAPEAGDTVDLDSFLNQFEFPDDPTHTNTSSTVNPSITTNGAGPSNGHTPGAFPLAAEFDLANPGPHSASFLDEVHTVPSGASDTSLSPAIPLLDDFSQAAPASPNTARFTTPTAPVQVQVQAQAQAAAGAGATKRGRKRRSVTGDVPPAPDEPANTATRATRK